MTNSRLTDPEVLEIPLPGAAGELRDPRGLGRRRATDGGDGGVAALRFLEPMTASILSNGRRHVPPFGLEGGQPRRLGGEFGLAGGWYDRSLVAYRPG